MALLNKVLLVSVLLVNEPLNKNILGENPFRLVGVDKTAATTNDT